MKTANISRFALAVLAAFLVAAPSLAREVVLVENGVSLAPIVVFENAPPLTRQAADELAYYIEKTTGARPDVIEGRPDPIPEPAIWVGYQPVLDEIFAELDFDFQHSEEILIAANESHLAILGRDVWDPDHLTVDFGRTTVEGVQQEYGTHNAVYTFLHDYLGVRWLWPGELGEDILEQETVAFEPFEYRYHPQVRARGGLLAYSTLHRGGPSGPERQAMFTRGASSNYWLRAQRLQLCELPALGGHGPWGGWWSRFHEAHPEYFALQPDGTRGGGETPFPSERNIKMCHSNPDLLRQYLDDMEETLKQDPTLRMVNASPGDGWTAGHCICENCRAWDHPKGEMRSPFVWRGVSQSYVALSDRDVTFANAVARGLKERFPDRDLYVYMLAYGHSRPAPVAAVPDDNVIIGNVANFLLRSDSEDRGSVDSTAHREHFAEWGRVTENNFWRPNVGAPVGFQWGLPDVPLRRTMDDMRFAAEHGWMGIYVDYVREYWATQGPLYYLMAQLVWNPYQDGEAILKDYYERAFGPAAGEMEAYWNYLEEIREECYGTENPGRSDHDVLEFYDEARLEKAGDLLDAAKEALGGGDDRYRERVAFVEAGLDFTRLVTECARLARLVEAKEDPDGAARARIHANWEKLRALQQDHPGAIRWNRFFGGSRGDGPPTTPRYAPTLWVP